MFVRFRKKLSDGVRPSGGVHPATHMCVGDCKRRRDYHCPIKPRCRWRIGVEHGIELAPYRLNVAVVENRRIDGKVRQSCLVQLGSFEGAWLPDFYADVDPDLADQIKADVAMKVEYATITPEVAKGMQIEVATWQRRSAQKRYQYWEDLDRRLSRLGNRIDPKTEAAIREQIHERIPRPLPEETEQMGLWAVDDHLKKWDHIRGLWAHSIVGINERIARAQEELVYTESGENAVTVREAEIAAQAEKIKADLTAGKTVLPDDVDISHEEVFLAGLEYFGRR